jgi:hypothetical protein
MDNRWDAKKYPAIHHPFYDPKQGAEKPPDWNWGFSVPWQIAQAMKPVQAECKTLFVWRDACGPSLHAKDCPA